jgi:hypothetical protein
MASINNIQLTINADRARAVATILVGCDLVFTQFEVNAMNDIGLQYSLECHLLDMNVLYSETVARFDRQVLPLVNGAATTIEHMSFATTAAMSSLHQYVFGKDTLMAQLVLTNLESGAQVIEHSPVVAVDLAA